MEKTELSRIRDFLQNIGIEVKEKTLPDDTFLPGLTLGPGCVFMDPDKLLYPGDLLHEAGHLAVTRPHIRRVIGTAEQPVDFPDMGNEIGAIIWSYAALKAIGLPPDVVFHPHGYKGAADWHIQSFESGANPGLPLLQWLGLTGNNFPEMVKWLCDEQQEA